MLQFSDHRIGGRLPAARREGGAGLAAKIRGPRAPHDQRDQREPQPEAVLQLAGGGQVRRGVVQPGGPRAAAGQARRHIPGAAAQLAAVPALQVSRQHARLRLSDISDSPGGLGRRPVTQARPGVFRRPPVPRRAVARHMISSPGHSRQHRPLRHDVNCCSGQSRPAPGMSGYASRTCSRQGRHLTMTIREHGTGESLLPGQRSR